MKTHRRMITRLFVLAALAVFVLPALADGRAKSLKVTPAAGTPTTSFRIAFKPGRTATDSISYQVRMDWRGGKAKRCDKYAARYFEDAERGRWEALRLKPDTPAKARRWCKGTWVGRVVRVELEECSADEICRDPDVDASVERRWIRHVR